MSWRPSRARRRFSCPSFRSDAAAEPAATAAPSHHWAVARRRPKTPAMVTCTRNKVATLKRVERGWFLVLDEQVKWKVKKSRGQRIKRKQKQ
ncbi:hypothetical protein LINPERHAP1_LOCUS12734 [Linum perenne]